MNNISILNQDKISRFQSELNNRKNKIMLNKYNMSNKENSTSNIAYQENPESQQKSDAGFLQKVLATGGDILGNVFSGIAKGVEGLYDFGASIVGGVGGLFDKNFQDRVKEHIAYDFVGENLTNPINKSFKDSYLNDWGKVGNFIQNVSNGVGQMLPSVVSNLVVPGSGLATLGLSATGNSTESAFKDGASYYRGLGYGAVSGAVEVATEKIGGKLFGNSTIDDALGLKPTTKTLFKGAKTKVGKVMQEALGEGIEEGLSELVSPLTENIYKDKNFFDGFLTKEHLSNIGQSALVGASTSLVYGGTLGKINKNLHNANESLVELNNLDIKQENLHNTGELYEGGNEQKIEQFRQNILQELSDSVSKMNESSRTKFIENNKLQTILNSDGSLITNQSNDNQNTVLDKRYYSPALRGKEQQIIDNLASQNVKTYSGELNSEENNRYTQFKQAQSALSKKGLVRSNYIISEASKKFDSYISGDTMVFGKDLFESDAWQKKLIHEVEHFTEGTKEWAEFADFVIKETGISQANLDVLNRDYGVTLEDIKTLSDSLKNGSLSKGQKTYLTELMATQSEYLFGNEQMINRLTQTKRNLAQKIFDRIKQFIQVLKAKTPEEKNMLRTLQKAESLFEKALSKSGAIYLVESLANNIDNLSEVKYSKKNSNLWDKLTKQEQALLYKGIDEIHHQGFWEYQLDNGDYLIDINNKIVISDGNFQKPSIEGIVEFNKYSTKISIARDNLYERITNGRPIWQSIEFVNSMCEEEVAILYGEENSKYNSESREQEKDNFQVGRDSQVGQRERSFGDTKYSLKDSLGNDLSKEQREFFKDSKVRNKIGELKVVYHGTTNGNFNEFSYEYLGLNGTSEGKGFYFTDNIKYAEAYTGETNTGMFGYSKENTIVTKSSQGKLFEVYLDIKKPLDSTKKTITKSQLAKFIKAIDSNGTGFLSNYGDVNYEGYNNILENALKNEYEYSDNDVDLIHSILNSSNMNFASFYEKLRDILGYDGIITEEGARGTFYIVFNSNQIKEVTNKKPTLNDDIRFSLKNGEVDYNYSKGQIAKYVAEHSKEKAYSKSDAEAIINSIVENQLSFDGNFGEISNKTKNQAVDILWHSLNTNNEGYRAKTVLQIADYIINKTVIEDIYQSETFNSNLETINILRPYLHKLDLKSISQEIQHHYDKDNSPYLLWATKDGGMSPDQVAQELESKGIKLDSYTSADLFFEMDSLYRNSLNAIKNQSKKMLKDAFSADDLKVLKQLIAKEILQGYDSTGHKTKFAETIDKYKGKIDSLKKAINDVKLLNKAKNNVVSTIERLKDTFVKNKPAGWDVPQQVVDFVKKISKVETWRNDISKNARQYLNELQNNIDLVMDETQQSIYPFREVLKDLGDVSKGNFTASEYKLLDNILRQFEWQLKNYNKVNFEDKAQNIDEIAIQGIKESIQAQSIIKNNLFKNLSKKVYANPYERMAEIGLYRKNSIAMRLFEEIKQGDRHRASFIRDASNLFDEFFSKYKNYLSDLQKVDNYNVRNAEKIELTKRQALVLYAISLREQGISHLFNISDTEGVVRLLDNKLSTQGKTSESFAKGQDIRVTQELVDSIKKSLTDADKQYLKAVNKFFNELSKNAKSETDKKLYGISNVEKDYYFPLQVSKDKIFTEAGQNNQDINQYVLSMGMNKSTKTNANNKLVIDGIDNIIVKHINNMAMYYGFAVPISAYNRIINKQIKNSGLDNTTNIRSEIMKFDTEFESYMNKLLRDVQGIGKEKSVVGSVLSKIRWATANSALGANPKVLVTQTTSLASGLSEFSAKYVSKGMAHFFGEKEKIELSRYSALMWERMELGNSVDTADIRQIGKEIGSKIGKVGAKVTKALTDFTTKPISWMDGNVIQTLWFASQYEVADTMGVGYEFGTEANKIEAGKRLDDVVFRTQQTSDPLGRSEWMRSNNEIVKFARMFTGDGIQLVGKLIADVNKYFTAKKMIKSSDSQLAEEGKRLLKETKTALKKSATAFILNQVMLVALAMMFKWIKGKKDDEEWTEIAKEETLANLFGLIPFGGDIYEKLSGYEPTNMAYTALSNIVDMTKDLYENSANLITGIYQDETKRNYSIRKTALSLSTLFGIPTRNIESYLKGIIGHVSPATREQYEALFKTRSTKVYIDKIKKATQNGDETLANTLTNIMYGSRTGKIKDKKVLSAITNLIEQDFDVLPKTISKSITIDGESINLTNRQFKQFQTTYATSMESVSSLINSNGFETMDSPVQAKAIKYIYDYYYNLAQKELLGTDSDKKQYLFAQAIDVVTLSKIVGQVSQLESDKDKNGYVLTGSKKQKIVNLLNNMRLTAIQKYMVMGYFGYKNANGERQVKAFIQTLKLTKTEKETLYKMSGY